MTQSKQFTPPARNGHPLKIILASTSPFRQKLLKDAGVPFLAFAPKGDEKTIAGLPPKILAAKRAEFKAIDVATHAQPDSLVIGADQVLGFQGASFDKSTSPHDALEKLRKLRGQTHFLHSAFCLVLVHHSGSCETIYEEVVDIPMTMHPLSDEELTNYVATGEWQGCVGGYRIEGHGRKLFSNIGGVDSAIIGLPMAELQSALNKIR